ncbi:MAG: hypothetical protein AAFV25_02965, partial [Bacteroidota bacterium]
MKTVICIAMALLPWTIFGQTYANYYQYINEAKRSILEKKYDQAILAYRTAFETSDFEFARDCINASELAAFRREEESTKYFVALALRRGVPLEHFASSSKYEQFRETDYWKELVNRSDKLQAEYQNALDAELRAEINDMFAQDQKIRAAHYKWYNFLWRPLIGRKWEKLNERQVLRLVEITKTKGFPGEKLIGIDTEGDHPKIESDQYSAGMPIVLLIHHYSKPQPSFDSLFREQIWLGNLHNQHYATVCDFEAKFGKGKFSGDGFYGISQRPKDKGANYDAKRGKIGLLKREEVKQLGRAEMLT